MYSYRMTPLPPGITIKQLRTAMDVMTLAAPPISTSVPLGSGAAKVTWKPPARHHGDRDHGLRRDAVPRQLVPLAGAGVPFARDFASHHRTTERHRRISSRLAAMIGATTAATSLKSADVVVGSPGRPGTPITLRVAGGKLLVAFWKPANSGAKITAYTVTCANAKGGRTRTRTSTASLLAVTGLTKHKVYVCTVTATNKRGTGPVSRPSRATPA